MTGRSSWRSTQINAGDRIELAQREPPTAPAWPVPVVHLDDHLLVIDKPAGLLTSTVPTEKRPTAIALLRAHAVAMLPRARVGLVHRLDRDASGLLVFSLSPAAHAALKRQFADRSAGRIYHAVVHGQPRATEGRIDAALAEYADGTVHLSKHLKHARSAITHYQTLATGIDRSLLRVKLETGRKHQIRAHLASIGHPIVGDTLYTGPPADRLMLAAVELSLEHPSGGRQRYTVESPECFALALRETT